MAGLRKGYPGLTHTAKGIAKLIGDCDIFCEPFAGLGRISKHVKANKYILNDMSDYSIAYLKEHFADAIISKEDFLKCILKHDAPNVTFLIDPPWARKDYADNPNTFCDRGVGDYYSKLAEIAPSLKGRWFVAGRAGGGSRSCVTVYFKQYESIIVESHRKINGHSIKTKLYYSPNALKGGE